MVWTPDGWTRVVIEHTDFFCFAWFEKDTILGGEDEKVSICKATGINRSIATKIRIKRLNILVMEYGKQQHNAFQFFEWFMSKTLVSDQDTMLVMLGDQVPLFNKAVTCVNKMQYPCCTMTAHMESFRRETHYWKVLWCGTLTVWNIISSTKFTPILTPDISIYVQGCSLCKMVSWPWNWYQIHLLLDYIYRLVENWSPPLENL